MPTSREQGEHTDDHVDTRRYHRSGMDHCGDRSRAFHGIGQPHMQRELGRLTHRADEEQQPNHTCGRKASDNRRGAYQMVEELFVEEDRPETECASPKELTGLGIEVGDTQEHENVSDAGSNKSFHSRVTGRFFAEPEADKQVGAQPHYLPPHEEGQQVVRDHQGIHPKCEQADEGEKSGIHRLYGGDSTLFSFMLHSCTVRRKTGNVMVTLRLAEVVVADAVDENHQHSPGHEEQGDGRERVDENTNLEESLTQRQPVNHRFKGMFSQVFFLQGLPEDEHRAKPG